MNIKKLILSVLIGVLIHLSAFAQAVPELLYYKFDQVGTTASNYATTPPTGTATATIMGTIAQGGIGQCAQGALIGSGVSANSDYLNTNWITDLGANSWTISFWSSGFGNTTNLYYIFGDASATGFRCFTNGVAGSNNWIIRGGGLTDVILPGGATASPTINTFVYDQTANQVRGYVNGVLVTTVPQGALAINGTGPFKVMGYNSNIGAPAGALLDEFRLYNRALSEIEILALIPGSVSGTDVQQACGSFTWIDGNTYNSNNNTAQYTMVGGSSSGCDSIITLNLTINQPSSTTDFQTACGSYTWIDGNTYIATNNSATYTIPGGAANGCDSIITLNLTINPIASGNDVQIACDSYTWIDGNTYTASTNLPTFTIVSGAANGCDSIVTLNLTINNSTTGTDVITACDSYTWIDGVTYTTSNSIATFTLTNAAGCDSIVTLNLTINNSTTGTDVIAACDSYTWIDGVTYTTNNSTATFTLTNAAGCDSIVTLNLTIIATPVAVATDNGNATISCATAASYQWIDCATGNPIAGATGQVYTITANGTYAVIASNGSCSDTSACITIDYMKVSELALDVISIYPNPTRDKVTVTMTSASASIEIIDAQGKLLKATQLLNGDKIDLSTYETGIYIFRVKTENGTSIFRVSKH